MQIRNRFTAELIVAVSASGGEHRIHDVTGHVRLSALYVRVEKDQHLAGVDADPYPQGQPWVDLVQLGDRPDDAQRGANTRSGSSA
jgi:hypothetical protein